ncbi:MAG: GNAT family N-acetyltransferase [Archangium sp.]|nr:GNAT family N-acetyltransferase [Archangium sp.]MDP3572731.1 GNAT family N-acetyltransferase [Archangium sp.]
MITVRAVELKDVMQVIALVRTTLSEFGIGFGEGAATDEQLLQLPESYTAHGGAFFVALDEQKVLGTAGIALLEPGLFELRKMFLEPSVRGKGLGQQLFDACLGFARARGGQRVVLDTTEKMTAAIAFYERNGFIRDDSQRRASRCNRGYRRAL